MRPQVDAVRLRAVRAALAPHPDGLTLAQLCAATGYRREQITAALQALRGHVRESQRTIPGGDPRRPQASVSCSVWRLRQPE